MNLFHENERRRGINRVSSRYPLTVVLISLGALVATFILANSGGQLVVKTVGFAGIIALYLVFIYTIYRWQASGKILESGDAIGAVLDTCLNTLDEANEYIAGSLKTADVFRLVTNRIADVLPLAGGALYLLDGTRTNLILAAYDGSMEEKASDKALESGHGPVDKCYSSRSITFETSHPSGKSDGDSTSVAIPLCRGTEPFGVLHLYVKSSSDLQTAYKDFFEALAERVAPLVMSSRSYEKSKANALTDATTDLPNERAFHLILENQIAEAHRNRGDRPLTILSMDIKRFDEINQNFGHAAGDQVLNFAAITIRDSLRQMDFFARASNDEFLAILPTASREISHEVIARVSTSFFGRKLKISDDSVVEIDLNFGWAAFGEDGETPNQLLSTARLRKEQSKSITPSKVLWFSREIAQ